MGNTETKAKAAAKSVAKNTAPVQNDEEQKIVPKEIDPSQYVVVRNGFQGMLVYKSTKTGEVFTWERYGDSVEMELRELRNARAASRAFFENNWFMFDEDWVVDYLGVRQYYKHAIHPEDFDDIFKKSPAELKKTLAELPAGVKRSVAYRASEMIASGDIDSRKTITALEEGLGITLIEK